MTRPKHQGAGRTDLRPEVSRVIPVLVGTRSAIILRHMAHTIQLRLQAPGDLGKFRLPVGVQRRLDELLDRQDQGAPLTPRERREAEGLVELTEMLSLLKLRASGAPAVAA